MPPGAPRSSPWRRSSPAALEPPAHHGLTWRARITDDTMSSVPVPRLTTLSNTEACRNAQRGGVTASADCHATHSLVLPTMLCCLRLLAF